MFLINSWFRKKEKLRRWDARHQIQKNWNSLFIGNHLGKFWEVLYTFWAFGSPKSIRKQISEAIFGPCYLPNNVEFVPPTAYYTLYGVAYTYRFTPWKFLMLDSKHKCVKNLSICFAQLQYPLRIINYSNRQIDLNFCQSSPTPLIWLIVLGGGRPQAEQDKHLW